MPFVSRKQIVNNRLVSGRRIVWFHYRRWVHTKNPLVYEVFSNVDYFEGLAVKYLSPQTAFKIREMLTEAHRDKRKTNPSILNKLKTLHPKAYSKSYRKYFIRHMVILGVFEIPLLPEEKTKVNKITKQRPEFKPSEKGRIVPKGLR